MTQRPNQHNFIDTARTIPPPPPIDMRGDVRPTDDCPVKPCCGLGCPAGSDPLPLAPGWTDSNIEDAAGVPPERWTPERLRAVVGVDLGEPGGDRTVYVTPPHILEAIRAELSAGANDNSDALRVELDALTRPRRVDSKRGPYPLTQTPTVTTSATHSAPDPPTRYVEGIAHVAPPQGVPDGFTQSREADLIVKALRELPPHVASDEQADRAAARFWADVRRAFWYVLAFACGGAVVGTVDWLRAVGRI